jgi:hypothetical protein
VHGDSLHGLLLSIVHRNRLLLGIVHRNRLHGLLVLHRHLHLHLLLHLLLHLHLLLLGLMRRICSLRSTIPDYFVFAICGTQRDNTSLEPLQSRVYQSISHRKVNRSINAHVLMQQPYHSTNRP